MIPPSLTLIVYGETINETITKLFMAGIIPGLILAILFMGYVAISSKVSRSYRPDPEPVIGFGEKLKDAASPFRPRLILFVIGSMYLGYATATEAAAIGVVGALVLAATQGSLNHGTDREPYGRDAHVGDDRPDSGRRILPVPVDGLHRPSARACGMDRIARFVEIRAPDGAACFLHRHRLLPGRDVPCPSC